MKKYHDVKQPNKVAKVLVSKRYINILSPREMEKLAAKI